MCHCISILAALGCLDLPMPLDIHPCCFKDALIYLCLWIYILAVLGCLDLPSMPLDIHPRCFRMLGSTCASAYPSSLFKDAWIYLCLRLYILAVLGCFDLPMALAGYTSFLFQDALIYLCHCIYILAIIGCFDLPLPLPLLHHRARSLWVLPRKNDGKSLNITKIIAFKGGIIKKK